MMMLASSTTLRGDPHLRGLLILLWLLFSGIDQCAGAEDVEFVHVDLVGNAGRTPIHDMVVTSTGNIVAGGHYYMAEAERPGRSSSMWSYGPIRGQSSTWGDIQAMARGDFNGDGHDDVVAAMIPYPRSSNSGALIMVHSPQASATVFSEILITDTIQLGSYHVTGVVAHDVKVVDWNDDGYLDILTCITGTVSGQSNPAGWLVLLRQLSSGPFQIIVLSHLAGTGRMSEPTDIDHNGHVDVAVLDITAQKLWVVWQNADRTTTTALIDGPQSGELVFCVAVGPLYDSNYLDIVVVGEDHVFGYIHSYPRSFDQHILTSILPAHKSYDYRVWQAQLADMNRDGLTDIVMIYGLQNYIMWSRQGANKVMAYPRPLVGVTQPNCFVVAYLNTDALLDIACHSVSTGYVMALYATQYAGN